MFRDKSDGTSSGSGGDDDNDDYDGIGGASNGDCSGNISDSSDHGAAVVDNNKGNTKENKNSSSSISSGLSRAELHAIHQCINQIARGRKVSAACVYGSKVAGYARPNSDIDLLVVLENYPFKIKYVYLSKPEKNRRSSDDNNNDFDDDDGNDGTYGGAIHNDISALIVDKRSLEMDAKSANMGEFVAGRLLHIYEPIINSEFLSKTETAYKRRIILEELQEMVQSTSALATEISFPLEYILFSKVKRRAAMYPNAAYSYFKTYADADKQRNLKFAMDGYMRALEDIVLEDPALLVMDGQMMRLSKERIGFAKGGSNNNNNNNKRLTLMLTKRLQHFGSYFVHSYAGRRIFHLAVKEAESKIRRHLQHHIVFPPFMANPAREYWRLPEGALVIDPKNNGNNNSNNNLAQLQKSEQAGEGRGNKKKDAKIEERAKRKEEQMRRDDYCYSPSSWLDAVTKSHGIINCSSVKKHRLGNKNSRTLLYVIKWPNVVVDDDDDGGGDGYSYKEEDDDGDDDKETDLRVVVKELARRKSIKWAALNMWTAQLKKRFKVDPMFRLGTEYRALRYLRSLGLMTPAIEAVVPYRRIIVTSFVDGSSLADAIKSALTSKDEDEKRRSLELVREVGRQLAVVHASGGCFGNIKPKNVIIGRADGLLWFTDLEQFIFERGDPAWDLAQFICWGLKGNIRDIQAAKMVIFKFFEGYGNKKVIHQLAESNNRYVANFYPVLMPKVARMIKAAALDF